MRSWQLSWKHLWAEDSLAAFRDRIAQHLCVFSALLLLPFTINHFFMGRHMLGTIILLAQGVLFLNGYRLRHGRPAPVPMWIMVLAFCSAVVASVLGQGLDTVVWAFPALFIGYFLLPRRQAQVVSLLLALVVPLAVYSVVGPAAAVRALAALVLTLAMINVVLSVIGELQIALVQQAITDPLTGAWNRRHFDEQLLQMQPPADAGRTPNVLLALDIDHFKSVNDRHGHAVGDAVLKALVQLVNQRKREGDQLFRTGGEEFILLLPRIRPDDARRVAEDLRQRIESTELVPGLRVTVSIGLSPQVPGQVASPWLAAADDALYEAKRGGRNRVVMAAMPA
jgi:diguanylate cyclase (GGDEF)-like protein